MAGLVNIYSLIIISIFMFNKPCQAIVIGLSRGRPSYSVTLNRGNAVHRQEVNNIRTDLYEKRKIPQTRAFKVIIYEDLAAVGEEFNNDNIILSYSRGGGHNQNVPARVVASERSDVSRTKPIKFPTAEPTNQKPAPVSWSRKITPTTTTGKLKSTTPATAAATAVAALTTARTTTTTRQLSMGTITATAAAATTTTTTTTTTTSTTKAKTTPTPKTKTNETTKVLQNKLAASSSKYDMTDQTKVTQTTATSTTDRRIPKTSASPEEASTAKSVTKETEELTTTVALTLAPKLEDKKVATARPLPTTITSRTSTMTMTAASLKRTSATTITNISNATSIVPEVTKTTAKTSPSRVPPLTTTTTTITTRSLGTTLTTTKTTPSTQSPVSSSTPMDTAKLQTSSILSEVSHVIAAAEKQKHVIQQLGELFSDREHTYHSKYKSATTAKPSLIETTVSIRALAGVKKLRKVLFQDQDIQSLLEAISMSRNTVDKIPEFHNQRRPRMQIVGSGRKLKKSELFQLHDKIIRLQSLLESRKDLLISEDESLKDLFEATKSHLMGLARLLLRLMAKSTKYLEQAELREFTKHFKFVRKIFPFI